MQQAMSSSTASLRGQRLRQARPTPGVAAAGRRPLRAQALFGFLAPPKAKAGAGKAQELVGQLLELVERSDGGLSTPPAKREEIAELVAELEGLGTRNPLRSPLLFGDYEVVYTSKPQAAGGAYRSPLGRVVFPGQRAVQRLAQPNICINEVSYKALGFIPGSVRQEGEFEAVSGDTLKLVFPDTDSKAKNGPPRRVIQIAYLDERIRVARAIPPEEAEEAEPTLFVFRRIVEDEDEEAEDEAPAQRAAPLSFGTRKIKAAAQEQAQPARRGVLGTQLLGRKDGLATMAEKRYAQQQGGSRSTGTISRKGTGTTGRGTGTTSAVRKTREELAAERAAARAAAEEERRAAREAAEAARAAAREQAAKAKAAAEEERRARQAQLEAERARAAEVKEAARKQLAQLQGEASEAADEAKAAASAAKDAEKAASELLKQASQARGLIDQAASAAAAALQQLDGLKGQEKEAAGVVAESRRALAALETASRRR